MSCSVSPRLAFLGTAAFLLLLFPVVMTMREGGLEDYKYGCQDSEDKEFCSWKCMMFTLQWPGGFCQSLYNESLCRIPETVHNWTIHGLWPQSEGSCRCWPVFPSDVEELEAELSQHWPCFLKTRTNFQFWRAEWQKHGATAACVEGLNSPLRYFQICLKLKAQFDIQRILEEADIIPSCERTYQVKDVKRVLVPHLGDKHEIQCVIDDQGRQVWFQVKIPLSRNLTVGCDRHGNADWGPSGESAPGWSDSPGHPCPSKTPFYYIPIHHQQPGLCG